MKLVLLLALAFCQFFIEGETLRGGHYGPILFDSLKTYDEAESSCEAKGMILAKDTSPETHEKLLQIIADEGFTSSDFWINGRRISGVTFGTSDGEVFSEYQPWCLGEPSGNGDCVQLWNACQHGWDDVQCDDRNYYICEPPASPAAPFGCSLIAGTDLAGNTLETKQGVQKAEDCCAHCQANSQCISWTWSVTRKSCYLRSSVSGAGNIWWNVAGIVSRHSNGDMKCSGYAGTDLEGPNLDVVENTANTDDCCAACLANYQCTVWAYDLSGKKCYLRRAFDNVVKTSSVVSGVVSRDFCSG